MHRAVLLTSCAFLAGCDPAVNTTLRLTPKPVSDTLGAASRSTLADPTGAVGDVALRFGLHATSEQCSHTWRGKVRPGNHPEQFWICVQEDTGGSWRVEVAELLSGRWSPMGDSLRQEVATALRLFGVVEQQSIP